MSETDPSDIGPEILRKHLGPAMFEDAINRLAKHVENGELLASTDSITFLNTVEEKLTKLEKPLDPDFLARQIVDDLFRAGIDVRFQQHVVEQTIRAWLAGSGR